MQHHDVVATAYNCFARNGVQRTTMDDIARELHRSRPVAYRFFSGRDDVFRAVAGDLMSQALRKAQDGSGHRGSTAERVVAVLEAKLGLAVGVHSDSPHHARELLAEDTRLIREKAAEYIQGVKTLIVDVLSPQLGPEAAGERADILLALARGLEHDLSDLQATQGECATGSRSRVRVDCGRPDPLHHVNNRSASRRYVMSSQQNRQLRYYRHQGSWRELQEFLPERLRLSDQTAPEEEFWDWNGHKIHLDRYRNPDATAKVVLHHGVGTNGRQMTLILGAPLAKLGFEPVAVDNLGFGLTDVAPGSKYTYHDWVRMVVDFLAYEKTRDDRPILLYGLSAGGMLTYHVAAAASKNTVAGIVGMTFLDQRVQRVRDETAHDMLTARLGVPAMGLVADTPLGGTRYSMALASKMSALANDKDAMKVFMQDKTSAANSMPIRFLHSYMTYTPAVEPSDFDACPILLTQPAEDRWSPRHLSTPVLSKITKVPVREVSLTNAGHYPLEDPGLQQMVDAIAEFIEEVTRTDNLP